MSKTALVMFQQGGQLKASVYRERQKLAEGTYDLNANCVNELAALGRSADVVLCPGGCLRPLSGGIYALSAKALDDARTSKNGRSPYDAVMICAAKTADALGIPAYFTEAMSVDEMLPLNRVNSHAEVQKKSRGFRAEHMAAMYAAADGRMENENYIAAYVDDFVSIGAYERGRCLDINDCIGAEGTMGFTSSGDVPCAQLANYFVKTDTDLSAMRRVLHEESGLYQYLGTSDPGEVDALCRNDEKARTVVDSMVYQIAKWIGSSALVLKGDVKKIIFAGKGVACKYLTEALEKKLSRIAPIVFVKDLPMELWLADQAALLGSCTVPIRKY